MNLYIWKKDWANIHKAYPDWQLTYHKGNPVAITGHIRLFQAGRFVEEYDIHIEIPSNYPHAFPILFETSRKIPHVLDRHIYTQRGNCCVAITHEQQIIACRGITIFDFIHKFVIPFLLNDFHFVNYGHYANGEYSHDRKAHIEFYEERLATNNLVSIIRCLYYLLATPKVEPLLCCCGSGRKFKKCHKHSIEQLKYIDRELLLADFYLFEALSNILELRIIQEHLRQETL